MKLEKQITIDSRRIVVSVEDETVTARDIDGCNALATMLTVISGELLMADQTN